ncbi:MAG: hypothetical protein WC119_00065 [Synergistaceae bacterium]
MPDITNETTDMTNLQTASRYGFSAVGLDSLGASEYTLATVVVDVSGSVSGWVKQLEDCLKAILKSCQSSPRADNLLLRLVSFGDNVNEVHGFRLLGDIDPNEYDNCLTIKGCTALFDATHTSVEATADYGKLLIDQGDMTANAVIYVLTDGGDNASKNTASTIKKLLQKVRSDEKLESIAVILIGVGYDEDHLKIYLDKFKNTAELDQFVDLTELFNNSSPDKALAKLAGYVSKSISSTSQALASGSSAVSSSLLTF